MFRDYLSRDERYKEQLAETLRIIDTKASSAGRTDFNVLGVWAAVLVAVIVAIVGGMGYLQEQTRVQNQQWMLREMDHTEADIRDMHGTVYETPSLAANPKRIDPSRRKMTAQQFLDNP